MLQRFKLGTKLTLVVALALVAMIGVAAAGYLTLHESAVGSDAYDRSIDDQRLIGAVQAPDQYLVEPYLVANQMVRQTSSASIAELANDMRGLKTQYDSAHAEWVAHFAGLDAASDEVALRDALLEQSFVPAETFWQETIGEFLPAMAAGQTTRAAQVLDGAMTVAFDEHRTAVTNVATLARQQAAQGTASAKDDLDNGVRLMALVFVALLLLVAAVGFVIVRSIRNSLRAVTAQANTSATMTLPRLVAQIETADPDAPLPEVEVIKVPAHDELWEMADAFNSVGRAAVQLAGKQAATRRGVAEMFVNLGRRNQALINRQLSFIDQLERDEQDPDTLEDLFRLDHLATRMRRNAESLLVLAGAEQARRWTESVDVANVVRSALSEIEEYNQVDLGELERVLVRGTVVADLAHLLAELLENATAFSPPSSPVSVLGRMMSEGYVISVVDEGIGMDTDALEEANGRIDASSHLDEAPTRVLGLYVVGRLAARHGIKVRLVSSHERGITARVLLPMTTFETPRAPQTPVQAVAVADGEIFDVAMSRLRYDAPSVDLQPVEQQPVEQQPVATAAPALPAATVESRPTSAGLTRRVRGAQLPDAGPARTEESAPPRSAEDVRALLTRFRNGVERGLEETNGANGLGSESTPSPSQSNGMNEGEHR